MSTHDTHRAYALTMAPRPEYGRGAVYVEVEDKTAWNAAVAGLGGSVLQSYEWGEFRRGGGWTPLRAHFKTLLGTGRSREGRANLSKYSLISGVF